MLDSLRRHSRCRAQRPYFAWLTGWCGHTNAHCPVSFGATDRRLRIFFIVATSSLIGHLNHRDCRSARHGSRGFPCLWTRQRDHVDDNGCTNGWMCAWHQLDSWASARGVGIRIDPVCKVYFTLCNVFYTLETTP